MKGLSKSSFKKGLNCNRALWLDRHMPEAANEKFGDKTAVMGTEVGELARETVSGTVLADVWQPEDPERLMKAAKRTEELVRSGCPCIAEATFFFEGHKCQVDLLEKVDGGWALVEVKSATNVWSDKAKTKVREDYLLDIAFQTWLLEKAGIEVAGAYLMHPNSDYRLHRQLDLDRYFVKENVTSSVRSLVASAIVPNIAPLLNVIDAESEPDANPGACCCSPKCPYLGHCLPAANCEDSILQVGGMTRKKAIAEIRKGIVTMKDYLHEQDLIEIGLANGVKKGKPMAQATKLQLLGKKSVSEARLAEWLAPLEGKTLYWLDFETWQLPIPRFEGDKPWEQVPTQFSLHVTAPDGQVRHSEHLAVVGKDPWRDIAEALCRDIPAGAVTIAYNKSFERDRIRAMAAKFPDLKGHLLSIIGEAEEEIDGELVDLIDPFRKGMVWLPAMGGSKSIKFTLPALFPDDPGLDYHNLPNHAENAPSVQNGSMAIDAFSAMWDMDDSALVDATRENLLRYCELDTWAMVKIWLKLRDWARLKPLPLLDAEAACPKHADIALH